MLSIPHQGFSARLIALALFVIAPLTYGQHTSAPDSPRPRIAIIIDDIGYHYGQGKRTIDLPGSITLAVIPFTPNAVRLAELGHRQGKEIMLHAPMANASGTPMEAGALSDSMNRENFVRRLRESIDSVPHVSGLNNHMGSLLTQLREPMTWLATELKQQNLYFVDSRTSPLTVAELIARNNYLPTLKRDISLLLPPLLPTVHFLSLGLLKSHL